MRWFLPLVLLSCAAAAHPQPTHEWTVSIGQQAASNIEPVVVRTDPNGDVLELRIRGYRGAQQGQGQCEIVKRDSDGNKLWTRIDPVKGTGFGIPMDMVVDSLGNPVVAWLDVYSFLFGGGPMVTKYSGSTGAPVWSVNTPLPFTSVFRLAVGPSDSIYYATNQRAGNEGRMVVGKFDSGGGAIWLSICSRTASAVSDILTDLSVGADGNAVVAGVAHWDDPCSPGNDRIVYANLQSSNGQVSFVQDFAGQLSDSPQRPLVVTTGQSDALVSSMVNRNGTNLLVFLRRGNAVGSVNWNRVAVPGGLTLNALLDLVPDGNGGAIAAAQADQSGTPGIYCARFDQNGSFKWGRFFNNRSASLSTQFPTRPQVLALASSSACLLAASRDTGLTGHTTSVGIATRFSVANGAASWHKFLSGGADTANLDARVAAAPNGDAVVSVAVATNTDGRPYLQPGTFLLDGSTGASVFARIDPNLLVNTPDYATDIALDGDGDAVVVGTSIGRLVTTKINQFGVVLWRHVYELSTREQTSTLVEGATKVWVDLSWNSYVAGTSRGAAVMIKLKDDGTLDWEADISESSAVTDMAVDSNGEVYLAFENGHLYRLTGAGGSPVWVGSFAGSLSQSKPMYLVASSGALFIAGKTWTSNGCGNPDTESIVVQRYDTDLGVVDWTQELQGVAGGTNIPCGIKIDANGDVVVAGTVPHATDGLDALVAKLNISDGSISWVSEIDQGGLDQRATGLACDEFGNVFVVADQTDNSDVQPYVFKLGTSDGITAWSTSLAAVSGVKNAFSIVMDLNNNPLVACTRFESNQYHHTIDRLDTSSGTIDWSTDLADGLPTFGPPVKLSMHSDGAFYLLGTSKTVGLNMANIRLSRFH